MYASAQMPRAEPLQLKAFAVYQENHGDPLHAYTSNNNNNYPAHAQKRYRHIIYIYTHRESLVRNHEPCAKALGNYTVLITRYTHQRRCLVQIATKGSCMPNLRGIPEKPWRPIASTSNNYYLAHAQRMRRSVTDIYIYIYIYPSREPSAQS